MTRLSTPRDLVELMEIPFSDEQMEAITAPMAPGVIIAGAGTGKTTVMAARVVWLVGSGEVTPDKVLGLTFTRKATSELSARVRKALGLLELDDETNPDIFTYDGFASRLVSEFGPWVCVSSAQRILTTGERYVFADHVVQWCSDPPEFLEDKSASALAKDILGLEGQIQAHLVTDADIENYTSRFIEELDQAPLWRGSPYAAIRDARRIAEQRLSLLHLCRNYRAKKLSAGAVEFADQMRTAVDLTQQMTHIGAAIRNRYGLVVVDEYQDTSAAQARLLSGLFGAGGGVEGYPITAVGDPLQAIYTWRAAAVDNIHRFHDTFPSDNRSTYTLSVNRRSGPQILDAANEISTQVRADPYLGGKMAVELQPSSSAPPAEVLVREFATWDEEVDWLTDSLEQAYRSGDVEHWSQVGILCRRSREIGRILDACRAREIPAVVSDLGGLLGVEAVWQVFAMMKILVDVDANPEVMEILTGPRFRVGLADCAQLGRQARHLDSSLLEALSDLGSASYSDHGRTSFERLTADIDALTRIHGNLVDRVHQIQVRIGLDAEIYSTQEGAQPYLRQFLDHVAEFSSRNPEAPLAALVAYLKAEESHGQGLAKPKQVPSDAVNLLTIHAAKGLEWDVVYLPGLVEGVFPDTRVTENLLSQPSALPTSLRSDASAVPQILEVTKDGLADFKDQLKQAVELSEDRLAYVGVTRAKRRLVVSCHRWRTEVVGPRTRSRYVDRILDCGESIDAVLLGEDDRDAPVWVPPQIQWPELDDPKWVMGAAAVTAAISGEQTWETSVMPSEVAHEISSWDEVMAALDAEESPGEITVALPSVLSASQVVHIQADPQQYAARLARPLPAPPSRRADVGSRFHAWVEQYYVNSEMITSNEVDTDGSISDLCSKFLASQFASARPWLVEEDFMTTIDSYAVSGRIDAVFRADDNPGLVPLGKTILLVDWKTGSFAANPVQLVVYARAWAARTQIPVSQIAAGFFYVSSSEFVEVDVSQDYRLDGLLAGII
ncbi:MAG: ATP-dependent helicase [Propionibacteriaceae bacterium]|nr:ATP-dependent helicase [Propionibacteriaceae bacterium]